MLATVSTLIFVPLVFAGLHRRLAARAPQPSLPSNDLQTA
jgi:hypothetical protein